MGQDRKEKDPVPAEVWALAAVEKDKVAVKDAAGDKARDAAKDAAKAEPQGKGKAADKINRYSLEKGA